MLACGNEISNWKGLMIFFGLIEKGCYSQEKSWFETGICLIWKLIVCTNDHSPGACIIPTRINVFNWSSLEENSKETQRKQNQNKVNEAKTVENIASWSSNFIYRDL